MTYLEIILLCLLYLINGAFMAYKESSSTRDVSGIDRETNCYIAFFLNPFWLVGVIIIRVFFRKW